MFSSICFPRALTVLNERKALLLAFRKSEDEGVQGGRGTGQEGAGFVREEGGSKPQASNKERWKSQESQGSRGSRPRHGKRSPGLPQGRGRGFPLSFSAEALEAVPGGEVSSEERHTPFPSFLISMTLFALLYLFKGIRPFSFWLQNESWDTVTSRGLSQLGDHKTQGYSRPPVSPSTDKRIQTGIKH